jgi:hypothetical protein
MLILGFIRIYKYDLVTKIIALLIILSGAYYLLNFLNEYIKFGITFIMIGLSLFLFSEELKNQQKNLIIRIINSEKITLMFSLWIIISLIVTFQSDLRLFLVAIIIGFLVIKEITSSNVTDKINTRMKFFVIAFFLIYLLIIAEEIAVFLGQ